MKIKKVCAIFIIIYFYFIQYIFIKLKVWLTGISCFLWSVQISTEFKLSASPNKHYKRTV